MGLPYTMQQITRGVISAAPLLLLAILCTVGVFCYLSFRRRELDRVDNFLFSSVAFSLIRALLVAYLTSDDVVNATGFDKDTAQLMSLILSLIAGVVCLFLLSLAKTFAKAAFCILGLVIAWSLLYGNVVMIAISSAVVALLFCLFLKQKALAQAAYIITGSLQYSFIIAYSISQLVSHGDEVVYDAISDISSGSACSRFLPCIIRTTSVWVATLLRVAICIGQQNDAEIAIQKAETDRIEEAVERVIEQKAAAAESEEAESSDEEPSRNNHSRT